MTPTYQVQALMTELPALQAHANFRYHAILLAALPEMDAEGRKGITEIWERMIEGPDTPEKRQKRMRRLHAAARAESDKNMRILMQMVTIPRLPAAQES